jgi:hypothetical protein
LNIISLKVFAKEPSEFLMAGSNDYFISLYNITSDSAQFLSKFSCSSIPISLRAIGNSFFIGMENGKVLLKMYVDGVKKEYLSSDYFYFSNSESLSCSNEHVFGISSLNKNKSLVYHHQIKNKTSIFHLIKRDIHINIYLKNKKQLFSAGKGRRIIITNVLSGKIKSKFIGLHRKMLLTMIASSDENLIFTTSIDKGLRIFSTINQKLLYSFTLNSPAISLHFSQYSKNLISGGFGPDFIFLFRTKIINIRKEIQMLTKKSKFLTDDDELKENKPLKRVFSRNFHLIF